MIQKMTLRLPGADIAQWLVPLGRALVLAFSVFKFESLQSFSWSEYKRACVWMGLRSFHIIALAAVFVATALIIELVIELQKYHAQDMAGALIAVGLLREIGPLVVGLAWCARIAAFISEEAQVCKANDSSFDFSKKFILPRLLAALTVALPLATYGLLIGFITSALVSPLMGGSATNDFLHSAIQALHDKDLFAYFFKLAFVNPIIAVFAGCVCGMGKKEKTISVAANAVGATFICGFIANLAITVALFLF